MAKKKKKSPEFSSLMMDEDLRDLVVGTASKLAKEDAAPMVVLLAVAMICHSRWTGVDCLQLVNEQGDILMRGSYGKLTESDEDLEIKKQFTLAAGETRN